MKHLLTTSASQTRKTGYKLAKEILATKNRKTAVVIGLQGNLGAGKTTFAQGFAKGLGIKEKINSPTFVIQKKFEIRNPRSETNSKYKISKFKNFYHIDCYRLQKAKDLLDLGFKEIISNPKNIVLIEWPEVVKKILPENFLTAVFGTTSENGRSIYIG